MKNLHFIVILVSISFLGLTSCATYYEGVAINTPSASITFLKGDRGRGIKSALQQYWVAENADCKSIMNTPQLGFLHANTYTVRLPANQRVLLQASTLGAWADKAWINPSGHLSSNLVQTSCNHIAMFTPETGHRYEIRQIAEIDGECSLSIRDVDTNTEPPSLIIQNRLACDWNSRTELPLSLD